MTKTRPFTAEKIATRLDLIAPHIHRRRQPLPEFGIRPLPGAILDAPICEDPTYWEKIPHNSYWGHADLNFVMKCSFQVPTGWNPDQIALHFPLGVLGDIFNHPEALVHVDRIPIGSADRYHHTLPLRADLADGRSHVLSLHGWTGLAGWPPDPKCKAKLFMGSPEIVERDPVLLGFYQLAQTALDTARTLGVETDHGTALLEALDRAFIALDTRDPIGDRLYESARNALELLRDLVARAGDPLDVTVHGIGHAHMDIAYLWPISQIRLKNARTFSNVLRLMEEDPDFTFSHSQPQLYAMVAEDYPEIFEQIKARVAEGRWEVMGGMWVEPDLNVPGPEALIRQMTLGRGYFKDTFGDVETPVLWLPDTFGFPAQIPQLMKMAGLKWFVTNKLNWNQINQVPSSTHHWEGLDGTRVLAHVLTTPRDVQYLPFPTNYKSDLSAPEVLGTWTRSTAPVTVRDLPICYGYGDGGGGPTETLLAKARLFQNMPGMPRFRHSTVRQTFEKLEAHARDLPVWSGEHYMEGHRGVFTSQGWIKRANRLAEAALHEAEALAAMAGQTPDLEDAWRLLCLNQFHDIITGTSITEVFDDARKDFAAIRKMTAAACELAASALALNTPAVANVSPISGARMACVDPETKVEGQLTEDGKLIYFNALPSYSVTDVRAATTPETSVTCTAVDDTIVLENAFLRVVLTSDGRVKTAYDKGAEKHILREGALGNQLIAFEDRPICWDAWDIDASYEDRPELVQGNSSLRIVEEGPLRACIEVTTQWKRSKIRQRIQLCAHSSRVDFVTDVDWHEQHTLLKAAFPTGIEAKTAEFDIQWGRVERAATRDTSFDAARFEVPAQKWAQVRDAHLAVALLNDCKYGYDVLGGTLRITLIKSATSPDPVADQGRHVFTYSLFSYDPGRPELLDHEAYDLNAALRILRGHSEGKGAEGAFLKSDHPGVILQTLKPSENGDAVIVRGFESKGKPATATLRMSKRIARACLVDIFENPIGEIGLDGKTVEITLRPFEIFSVRLELEDRA